MTIAQMLPVYGLTLHRPWPWAIFHAGRLVESRNWFPPQRMLPAGCWFAVHAGKGWDQRAPDFIKSRHGYEPPAREHHPSGVIAGGVEFRGAFELGSFQQGRRLMAITRDDVMQQAEILRWTSAEHGRVAWVLGERVEFDRPLECSGKQGLWRLTPEHESKFLRRIRGG